MSLTDWSGGSTLDVFSTPISAGAPAGLIEVYHGFPKSLQVNVGIVPRLGHDRFLPDPLQFT
jgi:hypothetical protein